ncbi:MAG: FAD-dependent oxidoreductase [Cyclobacteriaceae bacterium]|nr:FAD-dependent oxidoreductase [Cyclobacteriaceae bacterium]
MKTVVIGSGIVGMFSAYYLTEKGRKVTILEKEEGPAGASIGNAGMIVPSHFTPLAAPGVMGQALKWMLKPDSPFALHPTMDMNFLRWGLKFIGASRKKDLAEKSKFLYELNLESRKLYEEFIQKEKIEVGFQPRGLIMLCKTEKGLNHEKILAEQSWELGMKADILTKQEAEKLNGGLELDILGGVYYPNDAFLTPGLLLSNLEIILKNRGVEFIKNIKKIQFSSENNEITSLQADEHTINDANEYVIAAGMGSVSLAKSLGVSLPMISGKGYSVTMKDVTPRPEICGILTEARVAYTPMVNGVRFGGTMELGGKLDRVNKKRLSGIFKSIPRYFPDYKNLAFEQEEVWSGLRPCTPDGLPIIGRLAPYKNAYLNTGHAMMGLSLGPVSGKRLAGMVGTSTKS